MNIQMCVVNHEWKIEHQGGTVMHPHQKSQHCRVFSSAPQLMSSGNWNYLLTFLLFIYILRCTNSGGSKSP